MIATSTSARIKWEPAWMKGREDAPRFFFRAPNVIERMEFEAMLAGEYRAGKVFDFQVEAAFEVGLNAMLADAPDDAEQIKAVAAAEKELKSGEQLPPGEAAALAEARETLANVWPDYRNLLAQGERRRAVVPVLAFRRFCVGWEGGELPPFKRGLDGEVDKAALDGVDPIMMQVAGTFAFNLSAAGDAEKKASAPRSNAGAAPTPSPSPDALADGLSEETSGG